MVDGSLNGYSFELAHFSWDKKHTIGMRWFMQHSGLQSQQRVPLPSPEKNYDHLKIQDTLTDSHIWWMKHNTLHIIGGGTRESNFSWLLQEPLMNRSRKEVCPYIFQTQLSTNSHYKLIAHLYEAIQDPYKMEIAGGEPGPPTCCRCRQFSDYGKGNPGKGNPWKEPLIARKVIFKPGKVLLIGKPKPPPPKGPRPPRPAPPKMSESFKTASKIVVAEGSESFETAATKRSSTAHWEGPKPITFDGGYEVDND